MTTWREKGHIKARRFTETWDGWLSENAPDWVFNVLSLWDREHFTPFCWVLKHQVIKYDKGLLLCATCGKGFGYEMPSDR